MSRKRFLTAMGLGLMFGVLCASLAGQQQPELSSVTHPIFWAMVTDRLLIGMTVGFAGAFTYHPVLGFRYRPWLRGGCLGLVVSLPLACGALSAPAPAQGSVWIIFWATLLAGAVYGTLIDVLATKIGGEGSILLSREPTP
ncbi:MAG: hypothetical protein HQL92_07725 [Magnetococcales bacterium]|nr:hypothetical protein [Magnetococcales bacterium]